MPRGRRPRATLRLRLFAAATLAILTGAVAAVQLSGPLSAAIVVGDSMESAVTHGDLVVLREASGYEIGDIVAYHHPDLRLLLHRIVAREDAAGGDGRFTLKGDNRPRPDAYRPLPSEIKGRQLLRLPGAGLGIRRLSDPRVVAVLIPLAGVFALYPLLRSPERRRRARQRIPPGARSPAAQIVATVFGLTVLAAAVALAALHFVEPTHVVAAKQEYQHTAAFHYRAPGGEGVYDTEFAESGDPVFLALTDAIAVTFDYRFESTLPATISGSTRLLARLSQANGWNRTIVLIPQTPFNQPTVTLKSDLDLAGVQRLVERVEEQTGVPARAYKVTLVAEVDAKGRLAGQPFADRFTTELPFGADAQQLQLARGREGTDPLARTQSGTVTTFHTEQRALKMLGAAVTVAGARGAAVIVLGGSVAALAALGGLALLAPRRDEVARIRARYKYLLLPVRFQQVSPDTAVAEVAQFHDLVRLAGAESVPILEEESDVGHRFLVVGRDVTYYYRPAPHDPPGERRPEASAA